MTLYQFILSFLNTFFCDFYIDVQYSQPTTASGKTDEEYRFDPSFPKPH